MFISIIVPAFNVSLTLQRCIFSITSQPYDDWEMIIVDDGSNDPTGRMADKFAESDERIKVIHQENGGLSAARNTGIRNSKGEYLMFIDPDDELAISSLNGIADTIKQHPNWDIMEFAMQVDIGHPTIHIFAPGEKEYKSVQDYLLKYNALQHTWACNKLFKRSVFDKVMFPVGRYYEDLWLMGDVLQIPGIVIGSTNHGCYKYYWNENGISKKGSLEKYKQYIETLKRNQEIFGIDTKKPEWHHYYMQMLNAQIMYSQQGGKIVIPSQRIKVKYYYGLSSILKALILDIFGLKLTVFFYKWKA